MSSLRKDQVRDAMDIIGSRLRDAIRWRDKCHPCASVPLNMSPPDKCPHRLLSPWTLVRGTFVPPTNDVLGVPQSGANDVFGVPQTGADDVLHVPQSGARRTQIWSQ